MSAPADITIADGALFADLAFEITRQDRIHLEGISATRDGVFKGIKTAVHELDFEAIRAWDAEKRIDGWPETRAEMLQAAAVIMRTIRSIDAAAEVRS